MVVNRQPIEALQMSSCPHDPCAGLACPAPYTAAADDALCTCECKRMRPLPPALLHQSWSTSSVAQMSPQIAACVRSWVAVNPSMRHQIYDDAMQDEFIRKHYPQWAPLYFESLVRAVERSDVFRYLVVHKYGGFWADIDALAKRPITSLRGDLIVGREPQANADGFGVLQYFFGATPRHPFFTEHLLPLVAERAAGGDDRSLNSVLWVPARRPSRPLTRRTCARDGWRVASIATSLRQQPSNGTRTCCRRARSARGALIARRRARRGRTSSTASSARGAIRLLRSARGMAARVRAQSGGRARACRMGSLVRHTCIV